MTEVGNQIGYGNNNNPLDSRFSITTHGLNRLTLLNAEDTLYFRVVATTTGERTLEVLFNKHPITSFTAEDFVNPYLRPHPHFPIFQLRAVVLLLQKLEEHIEQMERAENAAMRMFALGLVAEDIVATTGRLRELEGRIMMKARDKLEKQVGGCWTFFWASSRGLKDVIADVDLDIERRVATGFNCRGISPSNARRRS